MPLFLDQALKISYQFKDAGGFEALVTGKTSDMQKIDVTERITSLERLNPTPRPTTKVTKSGYLYYLV